LHKKAKKKKVSDFDEKMHNSRKKIERAMNQSEREKKSEKIKFKTKQFMESCKNW
jgi:hypothetical protein